MADERSEQAKFKRAERAQHVLRCKFGADTKCWLLLGANFCGIKGNARNFPRLSRFVCPDLCDDLLAVVWARCVAGGFPDCIAIGLHEMIEAVEGVTNDGFEICLDFLHSALFERHVQKAVRMEVRVDSLLLLAGVGNIRLRKPLSNEGQQAAFFFCAHKRRVLLSIVSPAAVPVRIEAKRIGKIVVAEIWEFLLDVRDIAPDFFVLLYRPRSPLCDTCVFFLLRKECVQARFKSARPESSYSNGLSGALFWTASVTIYS